MNKRYEAKDLFGEPQSRKEALATLEKDPDTFSVFCGFREEQREKVLQFLEGKRGVEVLYDSFFQHIMNPWKHRERCEALIGALLGEEVEIEEILPRNGEPLIDQGSFVIMDIIVRLKSGGYVDVEMQKVGYQFPSQRSSCYMSDIVLRQYTRLKDAHGKSFSYDMLQNVYLFVLMEHSPYIFREAKPTYIHRREISYDSGIALPEIENIYYISLDSFLECGQNEDTELSAWLTFFSKTEPADVIALVNAHPEFLDLYREIAEFRKKPEVFVKMFSEALYIMDRNAERMMVEDLQKEVEDLKKAYDDVLEKNEDLQKDKNNLQKDYDTLQQDNEVLQKELNSLKEQLAKLQ